MQIGLGLWLGTRQVGDGSSLNLNFLSGSLDSRIDFTRTTSATFVGSNGLIQNTPASVNLLTFTQEFDNAAWTKTDTTVTANSLTAPDGTGTGDTLTEGSAGSAQVGANGIAPTAGATTPYSIYLKRGNTDWVRVQILNGANGFRAWFNLNTGAVGTSGALGTGTLTEASIVNAGDGWYRCILVGAIPSTTTYSVFTNTASANNSGTRVSGGTYAAWGAQLEVGSTATTYTRNVGGVFPARFDYDPVTLAPRGILIEEQRTNLLLNSLINGTSLATQNVTVAAVAHTFSFYGTGTVTVSGAHSAVIVGTGAYPARTTLTFTPSAGTLTVTVAGTVQFANLEAGAFATSYIPTVASQVTRTADQASIVAPMFAPWYNQTEGTFVVEAAIPPDRDDPAGNHYFSVSDGGTSNTIRALDINGTRAIISTGGVTQLDSTVGAEPTSAVKFALAFATNNAVFCVNGVLGTADTSVTLPVVNALAIGARGDFSSTSYANGHIRSIKYFPVRLSNAQLQALTV